MIFSRFRTLLLVLLFVGGGRLFAPPTASAQAQHDPVNLPNVSDIKFPERDAYEQTPVREGGASATLVAASLETAGYKMQSIVLRDLGQLLTSFGALVYICCALFAIASYTIFQRYDSTLWFLIGPAMFYWLVFTQVQSAGVDWQFGQSKVETAVDINKRIGNTVNANVSWFFDTYNRLISEVVQNLVTIIAQPDVKKKDSLRQTLSLSLRQQVVDTLYNSLPQDGNLSRLIQYGLKGECAVATDAARKMALARRDRTYIRTPEFRNAFKIYLEYFQTPAECLGQGRGSGQWWEDLKHANDIINNGVEGVLEPGPRRGSGTSSERPDVHCGRESKTLMLGDSETRDYLVQVLNGIRTVGLKGAAAPSDISTGAPRRRARIRTRDVYEGDFMDRGPGGRSGGSIQRGQVQEVTVIKVNSNGTLTIIVPNGRGGDTVQTVDAQVLEWIGEGVPSSNGRVAWVRTVKQQNGEPQFTPSRSWDVLPSSSFEVKQVVITAKRGESIYDFTYDGRTYNNTTLDVLKWGGEAGTFWEDPYGNIDGLSATGEGRLQTIDQVEPALRCVDPRDLRDPQNTLNNPISCYQVWCWSGWALRFAAEAEQLKLENTVLAPKGAADAALVQQIWREIAIKMTRLPDENPVQVQLSYNGRDLLGHDATPQEKALAEMVLETMHPSQGDRRIHPDPSIIPTVIAGVLLRNEMMRSGDQNVLNTLGSHTGWKYGEADFDVNGDREDVMASTFRIQQDGLAQWKRYETYTFAMTLPYMQGILLYFLAMLFPFFGIFLLIPEKFSTFFGWLALWAWVKAWDVGWAVALVLDDVLWSMMPHSAGWDPRVDPRHAPITLLDSAFAGDPSYNLANYYNIMGLVLIAVPVVSAQMVLGARGVLGAMLVTGLQSLGQPLAKSASDWTLHNTMAKLDIMKERNALAYAINNFDRSAAARVSEMKAMGDSMHEEGSWMGNVGQVGGGLLMVGGLIVFAASFWTGAGAVVGLGMMGAGAGTYGATSGSSKNLRVQGNRARVLAREANAMLQYYKAGKQEWFLNLDAIRGQLSGRGEFWVIPESPVDQLNILKQAKDEIAAERLVNQISGYGGAGLSIATSFLPGGAGALAGKISGQVVKEGILMSSAQVLAQSTRSIIGQTVMQAGTQLVAGAVTGVVAPKIANMVMDSDAANQLKTVSPFLESQLSQPVAKFMGVDLNTPVQSEDQKAKERR